MRNLVLEQLAARVLESVSGAEVGHCLRVDDIAETEAFELARLLASEVDEERVRVAVLSSVTGELAVDVETAVGIRNDKARVFVLLVPPGQAHAASSLDNSFERLALVDELEAVAATLKNQVARRWPELPVTALFRKLRVPIEARLDYLAAVLESDDHRAFGRELWRVGLLVDTSEASLLRANLELNAELVAAVARPSTATTTVRERLRKVRVAPGEVHEKLVAVLDSAHGDLRNTVEWTHRLYTQQGITLSDIPWDREVASGIVELHMESFTRADGAVEKFSKLESSDSGALYIRTSPENPSSVGLRWKTKPAKPTDVASWLLELLPPADLRDDATSSVIDRRVKGTRMSTSLSLELGPDDLVGGALFVVRITALDANGVPLLLSDETPATADSDQFEVVIEDSLSERPMRHSSAASLAEAQLNAVLAGAPNTDIDMQAWDLEGKVFSARIGKHLGVQLRVAPTIVGLQRRVIADPAITAFEAKSDFGEPIVSQSALAQRWDLPAALARKRKDLLALLARSAPQDVPEVFSWDPDARKLAIEYAQSYKRALDAADDSQREALLRLDTVSLEVGTAARPELAVVVLPIHPLRVAWIATHFGVADSWCQELLAVGGAKVRRSAVDAELFARVQPANLPFTGLAATGDVLVYFDEVAFGSAVLLAPSVAAPEAVASAVYGALDVPRRSTALTAAAAMVSSRLDDFRRSHPEARALRIALMNPGDGEIAGLAVESLLAPATTAEDVTPDAPRVEVVAYGRDAGFASPLPRLTDLQRTLQLAQAPGSRSHLAPPLGIAVRPPDALVRDDRASHIAIIQDVAGLGMTGTLTAGTDRFAAFHDLLTPVITTRDHEGKAAWVSAPALLSTPDAPGRAAVEAHKSYQAALGAHTGLGSSPALRICVEPDGLQAIRVLHEVADWVMTLDRFVGLDLYDDALAMGLGTTSYMLDYAPDFIEGLSHRLTVTTKQRGEVVHILKRAMDDLGLDQVGESVTLIIESLLAISGRLVLRLQGSESFAREAVSLAALFAHLSARRKLEDAIIVPVDSHEEIFGRSAREADHPARRCDLLLVRVHRGGLRIECVEVKSRKAAALPLQLADDIVDQLEETRRLLVARFFAVDPPRVDAALQRARLAGMLHYYADRAVVNGTLSKEKLADTHKLIDRHLEAWAPVEISMHGYVISLNGAEGVPTQHRQVPISVLTAADLGQAGFSTKVVDEGKRAERPSADVAAKSSVDVPGNAGGGGVPQQPVAVTVAPTECDAEPIDSPVEAEFRKLEPSGPPQSIDVVLGTDVQGADLVWSVSTKGSPHCFILGIPGQGKSVTTRRVVRAFSEAGLPSLLLDFHGDMAADPPAGASVLDASQGLPFSPFEGALATGPLLNALAFETAEIIAYVAGLGEIQQSHVYKAIQNAYLGVIDGQELRAPSVEQFAEALEAVEAAAKGKHARERVRPLTDFGLFAGDGAGAFRPREGGMVVDVSAIPLEQVQLAAGAFLLRKVYRDMFQWPQDGTLKLAVVLDEAHRLAKDVTLPKLMKEGRKYGVVVVVASQGAADFHRDVVGNAGTKIAFRTNFPASKQVAGFLRGRSGQDLSMEIEKLAVGQAYVSTPDSPQARRIQMSR
ncbi:ATP-binding protein [Cellulomonas sp. zg-ZUI199]|uniref:ATP-binding protein n=1 Tax=Cellulomonas wangleii TaxID=2816956 RepID=A0ABX8D3N6_9CELL|nr:MULTISPECIES: ATP-binding protein [Cellulomonas]MBO0898943.1 ATP-binding protein [Cellulomonas sp. zg-ZUI22]MBO0923770.1 ATP-binding protein [Cellulomonas wangleii]MBO0924052.1 ATP-binding protein [Cellulomonas wangleii]QVI62078.1 ATP-binding protein [Cellulomonas wangleii]